MLAVSQSAPTTGIVTAAGPGKSAAASTVASNVGAMLKMLASTPVEAAQRMPSWG